MVEQPTTNQAVSILRPGQPQPYRVTLEPMPDNQVKVTLKSQRRPGLLATVIVACDKKLVAVAAGACGEHLCFKYGDPVDPDRVAMTAERGFDGFVAQMNRDGERLVEQV